MTGQPRRQHLVDTACRLFNQFGYHATGIDRILEESGVSKATLYKHFRSKEELILAVLRQRHEQLLAQISERIGAAGNTENPVLVIFDALDEWFHSVGFYGCNFIKASGEYALAGEEIHDYAAWHKGSIQKIIESALSAPNKKHRKELAAQLALLADGAIVRAQVTGDKKAARMAKAIAASLLRG